MRTWIVKNQHEAVFGLRFEASRQVDAVTEYVVPIGHDVAEIDANSETDAPFFRQVAVAVRRRSLDSVAQRTAWTTLTNSISSPCSVVLTTRR